MTSEEMNSILSKPNNAIVGVNRAQGGPQLTTVWYAWDGTAFYFSTTKTRVKYINMQRNPSISLIVDDPETHKYVAAYGKAEIIEENIAELTRSIIKKYAPAEQVEQRVEGISKDQTRVIVVLRPDKIVTN